MKSDERQKILKHQYELGFFTSLCMHSTIKGLIGKEDWLTWEARLWDWDLYWWVHAGLAMALIYLKLRNESRFTE